MVDAATFEISLAALATSVAAIIPAYYNLFARRSEKRIKFEVERFVEPSNNPIQSDWSIRSLRPTKTIEHCNVEIHWGSGMKVGLPVPDRANVYEIKIPMGGGMNFRVPKGIVPEGSTFVIRDGDKVILKGNAKAYRR